jgi:hypothetical protein
MSALPQKRTSELNSATSALCQKRTCKNIGLPVRLGANLNGIPLPTFGAAGNTHFHSRCGDVPNVVEPIASSVTRLGILGPGV